MGVAIAIILRTALALSVWALSLASASDARFHSLIRKPNLSQFASAVKSVVPHKKATAHPNDALKLRSTSTSTSPSASGINAARIQKHTLLEAYEVIKNALERQTNGAVTGTGTGATTLQTDACDEINAIQELLYLSGCYEPFEVDERSELSSVLEDSCARCNLTEAYELALDLPSSCAENNYGESGVDAIFSFLFAFCSVDNDGSLCSESLAEMILFDFGDTPTVDSTVVVTACSGASCVDSFWDAWSEHHLDRDSCPVDFIDMSLLCVQNENDYCASVGEDLFVDKHAFLASQDNVESFCLAACGHAILDQYDAGYTAKEDCYNSYTTNIADKVCRMREDGRFCTVEISDFILQRQNTSSDCPTGLPSTWQSCDSACVDEISAISDSLGCCAADFPAMMYGDDEGLTMLELCDLTLPTACPQFRDSSGDSDPSLPNPTGGAAYACLPSIATLVGLLIFAFVCEGIY